MKEAASYQEKVPPQNLEAEQAVLGALFLDKKRIAEAQRLVPPNYFYSEGHRKIFVAILEEYAARGSVDLVIISNALRQKNQLEQAGGSSYLASLVDNAVSSELLAHHAGILKHKAVLRQVIGGSSELIHSAYSAQSSLEEILGQAQSMVADWQRQSVADRESRRLKGSWEQMTEYFASCRETPFPSLNDAFGGMFPGDLIVCGAWPGSGKSAFAQTVLRHLAIEGGWPVFYFGAEMFHQQIYARHLAGMCRIPLNAVKKGQVKEEHKIRALLAAEKQLNDAVLGEYIIKNRINAITLMSEVRRFADEVKKETGLVIVENLQQISWPGKKDKDEIDAVLSALRAFGIEMKTPLFISSQINRPEKGKENVRPTLADFKGTGNIEELADKVLILYRRNYRPQSAGYTDGPEEADVTVAKGGKPIILPFKSSLASKTVVVVSSCVCATAHF